jgi:hypothetical protein
MAEYKVEVSGIQLEIMGERATPVNSDARDSDWHC